MITITVASTKDIPTIQSIAHKAWPIAFQDILTAAQIRYMMEMMYSTASLEKQIQADQHQFLLAYEADEPIGYLSYQLDHPVAGMCKVHKVYLLPARKGKGVGRLLFDRVAALALAQSNQALTLNVNRHNSAVQFYEKLGFSITGQEDIAIGNGYLMEDYVLKKTLTP